MVGKDSGTGSSPRVRGAARPFPGRDHRRGIIPARAGSSIWRACFSVVARGSSPRVRGAVVAECRHLVGAGIIPARAGSRRKRCISNHNVRDHPRACGEQIALWRSTVALMGSSPRVRGAGQNNPIPVDRIRIIPARAGSSCSSEALASGV